MKKSIVKITFRFMGKRGHIICLEGNAVMIGKHLFQDGAKDIRMRSNMGY